MTNMEVSISLVHKIREDTFCFFLEGVLLAEYLRRWTTSGGEDYIQWFTHKNNDWIRVPEIHVPTLEKLWREHDANRK